MNNFEKIIEISYEDLEKISGGNDLIDDVCGCVKSAVDKTNKFYTDVKNGESDFVNGLLSEYGYVCDKKSRWNFYKTKALNFSGVFDENISNSRRAGSIVGLSAFVVAGSFALKKIKGFFNAIC